MFPKGNNIVLSCSVCPCHSLSQSYSQCLLGAEGGFVFDPKRSEERGFHWTSPFPPPSHLFSSPVHYSPLLSSPLFSLLPLGRVVGCCGSEGTRLSGLSKENSDWSGIKCVCVCAFLSACVWLQSLVLQPSSYKWLLYMGWKESLLFD